MQHRESAFALEKTHKSAAKVARRRLVAEFLAALGYFWLLAAVASLALVLLAKVGWLPQIGWWLFAALAGASIIGAAISASRSAWSPERSARELDRSLRLNNTLGSALELRDSARDEERAFIAELASRAEQLAGTARHEHAVRIRVGPAWYAWPLVAAIAFASFVWIPERSVRAAAEARKRAQETGAAAAEIRAIAKAVEESSARQTPDPQASPLNEKLSEIEEELAAGRLTAHDARVRTAEELARRAESTESRARRTESSVEEARRALARAAERSRRAASPEAARLSEALRKGDLEAAASELDRLSRGAPSSEREQAARELDRLAENLGAESTAPNESDNLSSSPKQDSEAASPEQLRKAAENAANDLRQSPQNSPESAPARPSTDQPPRASSQKPEEREPARNPDAPSSPGASQPREPSKPTGDADPTKPADERHPPQPSANEKTNSATEQPKPSEQPKNEPKGNEQSNRGEQSKKGDQSKQGEQSKEGDQPRQQPGGRPTEQSAPERSGSPDQQPSQQPNPQQPGSQPSPNQQNQQQTPGGKSEPQSGPAQQPSSGRERPQSREQPGQSGAESRNAERPPQSGGRPAQNSGKRPAPESSAPAQQPDQSGSGTESRQQTQPSGSQPAGEQSSPRQQPGATQSGQPDPRPDSGPSGGAQQLARDLRELSKQRQNAQQQRETARGLRDRAEQMLENASPEERARLQELARRLADSDRPNPAGSPAPWRGPTQTFDARPDLETKPLDDRPAERTIAEWLSEPKPGGTAPAGAVPVDQFQRARESANQAIEQQSIAPHYADLVRRVFKRYAESAQAPQPPGSSGGAPK